MIEVDGATLGAAGIARAGVGDDLESVCRSLRHAVNLLDATCADPQLSGAAAEFARAWIAAISASSAGQSMSARGLVGAAHDYLQAESAAATGFVP